MGLDILILVIVILVVGYFGFQMMHSEQLDLNISHNKKYKKYFNYDDDRHNDVRYNDDRHNDVRYNDDRHNDVRYNDDRYNDVRYNDDRYNDDRYNDVRYNDVRYNDKRDEIYNERYEMREKPDIQYYVDKKNKYYNNSNYRPINLKNTNKKEFEENKKFDDIYRGQNGKKIKLRINQEDEGTLDNKDFELEYVNKTKNKSKKSNIKKNKTDKKKYVEFNQEESVQEEIRSLNSMDNTLSDVESILS
jgi:hypothetical protein